jgi:nucleotide-binding universal stress UspA family protein
MKKILVPIDFSEFAQYALETAIQIAKSTQSEIDRRDTFSFQFGKFKIQG